MLEGIDVVIVDRGLPDGDGLDTHRRFARGESGRGAIGDELDRGG